MATDQVASTNQYLSSTKSVLQAGRDLQKVLAAKKGLQDKNSALAKLTEAGAGHDLGSKGYRAFMFRETVSEGVPEQTHRIQVAENVFASTLNDLEVANVYLAAGQNIGETGEDPKPYLLDDALNRLQSTTEKLEGFFASAETQSAGIARYGFVEAPPEMDSSSEKPSAIDAFSARADATLKLLVDQAGEVVTTLIDDIKRLVDKISPAKLLEALEGLGAPVAFPKLIGNFIQQGIEKIASAINALVEFLGSDAVTKVKDEVVKLWNDVTGGGLVVSLLNGIFATQKTKDNIAEVLKLEGLDNDKVNRATEELSGLALPYANDMAMAKRAIKAISLAATILLVIPIAGPKVALFAATSYGLVLALVVLVGTDYADSGRILKRVRGVGEITNSLRP
jgi:hypothetical protein